MSPDQRETIRLIRAYGYDFTVKWFRTHTGYADPGGAIQRLVKRGFVKRISHNRYRAVRIGERRV
jgi:hypothetical protein